MTCLGRFGFAKDTWGCSLDQCLSQWGGGMREMGDPDHVQVWQRESNEEVSPLAAPQGARVLPARALKRQQGKGLP